jgi:hypothetical protein
VRTITAGTAAATAGGLAATWATPAVDTVVLPVHAQTTPDTGITAPVGAVFFSLVSLAQADPDPARPGGLIARVATRALQRVVPPARAAGDWQLYGFIGSIRVASETAVDVHLNAWIANESADSSRLWVYQRAEVSLGTATALPLAVADIDPCPHDACTITVTAVGATARGVIAFTEVAGSDGQPFPFELERDPNDDFFGFADACHA